MCQADMTSARADQCDQAVSAGGETHRSQPPLRDRVAAPAAGAAPRRRALHFAQVPPLVLASQSSPPDSLPWTPSRVGRTTVPVSFAAGVLAGYVYRGQAHRLQGRRR